MRPVILLTVRPVESDFRYPLASELNALGHPAEYIFLKRQPLVTDMATGTIETWSLGGLFRHFAGLRRRPADRRPVVFNSTNLAFPWTSIGLRAVSGTRWCLDMHDELLYGATGWQRAKMATAQRMLVAQSDMIVHASPSLAALFPTSHHIGNASSLAMRPKVDPDPLRVLVLASIDDRFDFDALAEGARVAADHVFEVHGRIQRDDDANRARLEAICAERPNVRYMGPYSDATLPDLLSHYIVSFAPYRTDTALTEYIDPLRFYHCLASGVGIVSTPIAQARRMSDRITLLCDIADLPTKLAEAAARPVSAARSWRDVAQAVSRLIADLR
ncbi:hypothetical protein [Sphingomonas sp.]|uniref:hypothetical protein n=1 Tax=Sphingomonas sp. TaxID=28214 RepID=UPI0031E3233B